MGSGAGHGPWWSGCRRRATRPSLFPSFNAKRSSSQGRSVTPTRTLPPSPSPLSAAVPLDELVTGHYGLAQVAEALQAGRRDPLAVKPVVLPGS